MQRILEKKKNWVCLKNNQTFVDFKWSPLSLNLDFNALSLYNQNTQCYNHLEFHREVSNKFYLFHNLKEYCYVINIPLLSYTFYS